MKSLRRFVNPVIAFIVIQVAWVLVVVCWVAWFLKSHRKLLVLAERYHPELLQSRLDWLLLVEGLILLGVILAGVYVIFVYWRRQANLYLAHRNFLSQVSHELKSPLASLQLHLETIRLRQPDPERLAGFLDTMLQDTGRLRSLVDNLLAANRLEQRWPGLDLRPGDLSQRVARFLQQQRPGLPPDTDLEVDITPDLWARFEPAALETALRNLLENAVLYSDGPARIQVDLHGDREHCHLVVRDQGRGIDPKEQKKVFRMFYRGRRNGESLPGSGLGLFIVRAIVWRHKGQIWLQSEGPGRGTAVHIRLPRLTAPKQEQFI